MRNSEFGMRSWNWTGKRCSGIPHSALRIPHSRRRGVTLLEVLFAVMVTVIGLIGCIALIPVASAVAKRGRVNDAMSVASTTCVHDFDSRGMRRPALQLGQTVGWVGWNESWDLRSSPPKPANSFQAVTSMSFPYGTSFCIDPRFIAVNDSTPAIANAASVFPYGTGVGQPRMFRITLYRGFNDPTTGNPLTMTKLQADSQFEVNDDLTYDRPESDRTLMPTQTYATFPEDKPLPLDQRRRTTRQNDGKMSWMATVVPRLDRYTTSFNETYVLSIVMFYDRPADLAVGDVLHERRLTVSGISGVTGGEVLLTWPAASALPIAETSANTEAAAAQLKVRSNDWIMLSGVVSGPVGAVPVFKWYRVLDTEAEVTFNSTLGRYERYITLMGQDWPLAPAATEAVIVEGVVGVYEKTIRLE